jgi:hypothetical protein
MSDERLAVESVTNLLGTETTLSMRYTYAISMAPIVTNSGILLHKQA